MNPIVDQWDRMAQFYASFEAGHVTASTALKRLTGYTQKNLFYQANLQMGRILKENNPEEAGIDIMLLAHISPIAWSNVILYGEYKLNKDMVR